MNQQNPLDLSDTQEMKDAPSVTKDTSQAEPDAESSQSTQNIDTQNAPDLGHSMDQQDSPDPTNTTEMNDAPNTSGDTSEAKQYAESSSQKVKRKHKSTGGFAKCTAEQWDAAAKIALNRVPEPIAIPMIKYSKAAMEVLNANTEYNPDLHHRIIDAVDVDNDGVPVQVIELRSTGNRSSWDLYNSILYKHLNGRLNRCDGNYRLGEDTLMLSNVSIDSETPGAHSG
ncbi:hypothetical protein BDV96DRAFT_357451 [Lophiotrema nucula]|uniref:Uncharacterized protein n=1 Tax=Lophiotrema nucula TaxID=690887 RepID=A0A6A5YHC2_9PLEO|nr:hypothetical protein BDV96DRAFT_357451 [Lophiotrema nucula]